MVLSKLILHLIITIILFQNFYYNCVHSQGKIANGELTILKANCTSLDTAFLNFTKCLVKKNMDNKNVLDVYVKVRPGLVENISVNLLN